MPSAELRGGSTDWLEAQFASLVTPDVVVHIGAGDGDELELYHRFTGTRIVLIEPRVDAVARLRAKSARMPTIEIIEAAVRVDSSDRELKLMSFPKLSSLDPSPQFLSAFPGMRQVASIPVKLLSLVELVDHLQLNPEEENWLIIDAPQCDNALLGALGEGMSPAMFSRVFLKSHTQADDNDSGVPDVVSKLCDHGYRHIGLVDNADAALPRWHLRAPMPISRADASPPADPPRLDKPDDAFARNPYGHNRILSAAHRRAVLAFATETLGLHDIRPAYIDYLAVRTLDFERRCCGRIATTVQDAITRLLVLECLDVDAVKIMEIGSLYGVSLALLYDHASTRFSSTKVIGLDPLDGYYGKAIDARLNLAVDKRVFHRNMSLAAVPEDDYRLMQYYSTDEEALRAVDGLQLDVLVVDGDHSYDGVKFDVDHYFPLVRPGGFIVIDDYDVTEWPEVKRYVDDELMGSGEFEVVGAFSRTAIGRRRGA